MVRGFFVVDRRDGIIAVEYTCLCETVRAQMSQKISIIVPNWNGRAFLSRCIGGLLQSAVGSGRSFELLLMDDASSDGSAEEVAKQFPDVHLITNQRNLGFGHTVNLGARKATGDLLILVNNDLVPREHFIENLCRHFDRNSQIFGVSGKTVDWDAATPNHVNMTARFCRGEIQLKWSDDAEAAPTMFLQGGSCAVRRDAFLEIAGFQPLYRPAYWEDYDISYQALKMGFSNIYDPAAVGSHLGQGSMIRAYGEDSVAHFKVRNRLLFLALNITDRQMQKEFWDALPQYVRSGSDARLKHRARAAWYLLKNAPSIRSERRLRAARQKLSDREVFAQFADVGTLC